MPHHPAFRAVLFDIDLEQHFLHGHWTVVVPPAAQPNRWQAKPPFGARVMGVFASRYEARCWCRDNLPPNTPHHIRFEPPVITSAQYDARIRELELEQSHRAARGAS